MLPRCFTMWLSSLVFWVPTGRSECIMVLFYFVLTALTCCRYERVGQWYETYCRRRVRQHTLSTSSHDSDASDSDASDGDLDDDNEEFLRTLDPKEWNVSYLIFLCCSIFYFGWHKIDAIELDLLLCGSFQYALLFTQVRASSKAVCLTVVTYWNVSSTLLTH